jgi:hypothetical protein
LPALIVRIALVAALLGSMVAPAAAGTTGGIRGRVLDADTGAPIAGAKVTVASPSQTAAVNSDAGGTFVFISLSPDTYTVAASAAGYDDATSAGISVLSDQVQNLGSLSLHRRLKTIGRVNARSSSDVVRPGTTSDVYSVNAAGQKAAATAGGPGGLNQAYSAIATVPGANLPQGQQGWNQLVYIRGGDYSDVANELDGVPVQRASDSAPVSTLSSLGQQEVQTYTGGTPPSAEASGLSGYINQVIKTGTYPGYLNLSLGVGGPAFYHLSTFELSGATKNRLFSYYVGLSGVNQSYRYANQNNGAGIPLFFAPLSIPTNNGAVYDGSGPALFSPGQNYAIASTWDRENVVNLHVGIPHHTDGGKDDVQFLYVTSEIFANFYSSLQDLGGTALTSQVFGSYPTYTDANVYNGAVYAPPNSKDIANYFQPSSTQPRAFLAPLPPTLRDGNDNGMAIEKLQYQRNFSSRSFLRLFGYSEYTNWFINGPVSAYFNYSGELDDYEVHGNTFGVTGLYSSQLGDKNLLTATASYQTQKLLTYSGNTFGIATTNLVDKNGNCYNFVYGNYASCFISEWAPGGSSSSSSSSGGPVPNPNGGLNQYTQYGVPLPGQPSTPTLVPGNPPAGSPAANNGARWLVTENGYNAQIDSITPFFTAASVADQWRPNDKTTINIGLRAENYLYRLDNTVGGYAARPFWFAAYNREYCYTAGAPGPLQAQETINGTTYYGVNPTNGASLPCATGSHTNLANTSPSTVDFFVWEPRFGFTYQVNPNSVLRGSIGRYAAPAPTAYQQYNVSGQNLPSFISQFLPLGFNTPFHDSQPSYSNNFDLSWEQHMKGTDYSFEITPFYRDTFDQLQNVPIGSQGVLDGINTGRQKNTGIELLFKKGDFGRDGWSYQLSYTYTHSRIQFDDFANGQNVIDLLNYNIQQYNSFTSACKTPNPALCGPFGTTNAKATFDNGGQAIANPYYAQAAQPLFDRNGAYTPYDILPFAFQGANGYETPDVLALVVNYKHGPFNVTPTFTFSSGSFYGSPLQWPGYNPATCASNQGSSLQANTQTCSGYIFIPDAYTGAFDTMGAFKEPTRFGANMSIGYEVTKKAHLTLAMTGIIDHCYQRGYPWDNPTTCVYAQLPSNKLAPVGNFVTNPAQIPVQLKYPYSSWYNNSQTGYVGQQIPFGAYLTLDLRI